MGDRTDIQTLIPATHQDLVEAVPRGFARSATTSAILLGALVGSLWTYLVPHWLAATILGLLLVAHYAYRQKSNRAFDASMAELSARGMTWKTGEKP